MILREAPYTTNTITQDNNSYPLDGMVGATFHNTGTNPVTINNQVVANGQSYVVDTPTGFVSKGNLNIQFADNGGTNVLILNYHTVGNFYTDPRTGQVMSETQRTTFAAQCKR